MRRFYYRGILDENGGLFFVNEAQCLAERDIQTRHTKQIDNAMLSENQCSLWYLTNKGSKDFR